MLAGGGGHGVKPPPPWMCQDRSDPESNVPFRGDRKGLDCPQVRSPLRGLLAGRPLSLAAGYSPIPSRRGRIVSGSLCRDCQSTVLHELTRHDSPSVGIWLAHPPITWPPSCHKDSPETISRHVRFYTTNRESSIIFYFFRSSAFAQAKSKIALNPSEISLLSRLTAIGRDAPSESIRT